jgi:hypothetical protein
VAAGRQAQAAQVTSGIALAPVTASFLSTLQAREASG